MRCHDGAAAMIGEALRSKRIAITGATGFVGTALVERLLRSVPNCEIVLLVRPGRRSNAAERTEREVLRNDCFDRLRRELGTEFDAEIARRVTTIAGDVGSDDLGLDHDGLATLARCDVVVHAAASVSFDAAFDDAVEVNLLGPTRVAQKLLALHDSSAGGSLPHLISVSTAYVNSGHRGDATEIPVTESPFLSLPPWREEVDSARRARGAAGTGKSSPEAACRVPQGRAPRESVLPVPRFWPSAPSVSARNGSTMNSSTAGAPAHRLSACPTPTRLRSPSARWHSPRQGALSR